MTFALAFAGPEFALVAADTRGRFGAWSRDGDRDGAAPFQDDVRKVLPTGRGWSVTPGFALDAQVVGQIDAATSDATLLERMAPWGTHARGLWVEEPEGRQRELGARACLWLVGPTADGGFALRACNYVEGVVDDCTGQIVTLPPAGWPESNEAYGRMGHVAPPAISRLAIESGTRS